MSNQESVTGCWYFASSLYHPRMFWNPRSPVTRCCWKLSTRIRWENESQRAHRGLSEDEQSVSVMSWLALQTFQP